MILHHMLASIPRNKDADWLDELTYLIDQGRRQEQFIVWYSPSQLKCNPFRGFACTVRSPWTFLQCQSNGANQHI